MDAKLTDEPGRLAALRRYDLLDTSDEEPFDRITSLVCAVLGVPVATVSLIDADRQWLKSCMGLPTKETPREISFCTHTIQKREPMNVADALLDERFQNNPLVAGSPFIRSYLGVPLSTPDGYNVGSLCAIDFKPREFNSEQIQMLQTFAAVVCNEMELRRIAKTDQLTGTLTRRGFLNEAEKAIDRFKRYRHASAIVLFDLDHFKKVNDTFGHPAGDLVLRCTADEVTAQLRASDVLGRLGGEEFGVLVVNTGSTEAYRSAERYRRAIEAMEVQHDPTLRVTASFGVAQLEEDCTTAEHWIAKADEALYQAKRTGRNKSCFVPAAVCEVG